LAILSGIKRGATDLARGIAAGSGSWPQAFARHQQLELQRDQLAQQKRDTDFAREQKEKNDAIAISQRGLDYAIASGDSNSIASAAKNLREHGGLPPGLEFTDSFIAGLRPPPDIAPVPGTDGKVYTELTRGPDGETTIRYIQPHDSYRLDLLHGQPGGLQDPSQFFDAAVEHMHTSGRGFRAGLSFLAGRIGKPLTDDQLALFRPLLKDMEQPGSAKRKNAINEAYGSVLGNVQNGALTPHLAINEIANLSGHKLSDAERASYLDDLLQYRYQLPANALDMRKLAQAHDVVSSLESSLQLLGSPKVRDYLKGRPESFYDAMHRWVTSEDPKFTPPEVLDFFTRLNLTADQIVRLRTGAQANEEEIRMFRDAIGNEHLFPGAIRRRMLSTIDAMEQGRRSAWVAGLETKYAGQGDWRQISGIDEHELPGVQNATAMEQYRLLDAQIREMAAVDADGGRKIPSALGMQFKRYERILERRGFNLKDVIRGN
jgi:hypothetical protein